MGQTEPALSLRHPFRDLSSFPTASLNAPVWRVVKQAHLDDPWWYGRSGDNRFDLHPHGEGGTCYVADDPWGALLETVLRDVEPTGDPARLPPLALSEVRHLRMCQFPRVSRRRMADLTGTGNPPPDLHTSFGVTDELGTCASYERPQQWAQALWETSFRGVRYRLRRGNGRLATGLFRRPARIDAAGPAPSAVYEITEERLAEWRDGEAATLLDQPSSRELTVHDAVLENLHPEVPLL